MNLLIYGSNGWIGSQFIELLNSKNISYIQGKSRTDNYDTLIKEIEDLKPTHIVSFIGRTHGKIGDKNYTTIDYLEQDGKLYENIRDNLYSPLLLAKISTDLNIHYTYLGTGCIFNYDNEHPYGIEQNGFTENDKANFFGSSYSTVKGFTDSLMKLYDKNVLQLRIRMPITGSKNSRNFITKITNYEKICSIPNSMTVLPQLLPIALDMIQNNTVGTFNFTIDEQNQILDSKRSNNFLDTSKLENLYKIDNIKDAVKKMLIEYKNSL